MIGTGVATDLYAAGKTGIAINGVYDFWSPARNIRPTTVARAFSPNRPAQGWRRP